MMQTEELQKVWQVWRQCRLRYPGWVIAPDTSRESLWTHTEHWIEPAFHSAANLLPIESLLMLYELNWRLETALTPLFLHHVEAVTKALNQIDITSTSDK